MTVEEVPAASSKSSEIKPVVNTPVTTIPPKGGWSLCAKVTTVALVVLAAVGTAAAVFVSTANISFTVAAGGSVLAVALAIWGITRCCASRPNMKTPTDSVKEAVSDSQGQLSEVDFDTVRSEPEPAPGTLQALLKAKAKQKRASMAGGKSQRDDDDPTRLNKALTGARVVANANPSRKKFQIPRPGDSSSTVSSSSDSSEKFSSRDGLSLGRASDDLSFESGADPQSSTSSISGDSTTADTVVPPAENYKSSATPAASRSTIDTSAPTRMVPLQPPKNPPPKATPTAPTTDTKPMVVLKKTSQPSNNTSSTSTSVTPTTSTDSTQPKRMIDLKSTSQPPKSPPSDSTSATSTPTPMVKLRPASQPRSSDIVPTSPAAKSAVASTRAVSPQTLPPTIATGGTTPVKPTFAAVAKGSTSTNTQASTPATTSSSQSGAPANSVKSPPVNRTPSTTTSLSAASSQANVKPSVVARSSSPARTSSANSSQVTASSAPTATLPATSEAATAKP